MLRSFSHFLLSAICFYSFLGLSNIETKEEAAPKKPRLLKTVGAGIILFDFVQPGVSASTQTWVNLMGQARYSLSSDWLLKGNAILGLFPLSKSISSWDFRYFDLGLETSYHLIKANVVLVSIGTGYHYQTVINGQFGFSNLHGIRASLDLVFPISQKKELGIEITGGILKTDFAFNETNNEVSLGVFSTWKELGPNISELKLQADIKHYSLRFNNGEARGYFYSLDFLLSF